MKKILLLIVLMMVSSFAFAESDLVFKPWDEFEFVEDQEYIQIIVWAYNEEDILKLELEIDYAEDETEIRIFSVVGEECYGLDYLDDVQYLSFNLSDLEDENNLVFIKVFIVGFGFSVAGEGRTNLMLDFSGIDSYEEPEVQEEAEHIPLVRK